MTVAHTQVQVEQHVVDDLYRRLDELREQTRARLTTVRRAGPSGSPQNRSERDAFATLYEDRLGQLEAVEDRLCFGRLDLRDGDSRYIGRIGLTDEQHTQLLTDWRASAAQPFYQATAAHPGDVVRRRHLVTRGRVVTGIEDDVLDLDALAEAGEEEVAALAGEGALLAALGARRTGRMGDIVATIQAEQDAVIRAQLAGALVVQGGPGTGKTAVALHRTAYLLYAHRRQLERSGVLLIGPSRTFLRYIDQVLPSLGETGVVAATLADLFPGVTVTGTERAEVAVVKGSARMAEVVARAVRLRQRLPRQDQVITVEGTELVITRADVAQARSRARRSHKPHNAARVVFVREMLAKLVEQYGARLGHTMDSQDRASLTEELRTVREVRVALNLAWMPLTPQGLITDLYTKPHRLREAAPELSEAERDLLARPADAPWTVHDVPLLDEAAELLGEDDQAQRAQARVEAQRRASELDFARDVIRSTANGLVSAELLAERFSDTGPRLTTAERAAGDREWTYGHVVVDEAQELSAMAWRTVLRRCPTRSMTVVGDIAQTSDAAGATDWHTMLDPLLGPSWQLRELTVNYRTPATVTDLATRVAVAHAIAVSPLTSARDVPGAVRVAAAVAGELTDRVLAMVGQAVAEFGVAEGQAGQVAVIAGEHSREKLRSALLASPMASLMAKVRGDGDDTMLDAPVSVLSPRGAKGLEFDVVILVEPAALLREGSGGDLYVAMTRSTQRLDVLHTEPLPAGF